MSRTLRSLIAVTVLALGLATAPAQSPLPTIDEVIASKADLWGELALRQPEGPSYQFFERLLPPLRYVDASFHHYPIALSAPGAAVKVRLISNGSALNVRARQPNWRGETGVPVCFRVGAIGESFGSDLRRLEGPKLEQGYLPIVETRYMQGECVYRAEVFAAVEPELAQGGVSFLRFQLASGARGRVTAQFEGAEPYGARGGVLTEARMRALAAYSAGWVWNAARNTLTAELAPGGSALLSVAVTPMEGGTLGQVNEARYREARVRCVETWEAVLREGMQVEVPEKVVQDAWRATLIGSHMLRVDDEIRYSAGNQYAKLYEAEGTDAARSFLLWGHTRDARRMMTPLFDYTRRGLEYHQAAFKLQTLAHVFELTRDAAFVASLRPRVDKELAVILDGLDPATGLLPPEKYAGDIDTRVTSLNSNANCWRALRDLSVLLAQLGEHERARQLAERAAGFRSAILAALDRSMRREVTPPFVPIALLGEESAHDPITGTRAGSYWNLMIPYVLRSGVFAIDSEPATAIIKYLQQKGGLCMGLIRTQPAPAFWVEPANLNDLYGLRYSLALLQRDEPERALVSFYGKLAQGFTRDTFIGAEGSCLRPLDEFGRQMYLPPNSASNAHFLWMLRYLLVQDRDTDDDGRSDTLRLLFATPRAWLRDGATMRIERAPTAFGEISMRVESRLGANTVTAELSLPERRPTRTLLRLRAPEGWRVRGARSGGNALPLNGETLDLTQLSGRVRLNATVRHE